jgi:hypothetical protein
MGEDFSSAHQTMNAACEHGVPDACVYVSRQLRLGHGVDADPERADQLLRVRCDAGEIIACGEITRVERAVQPALSAPRDVANQKPEIEAPLYPMPFASAVDVPERYRVRDHNGGVAAVARDVSAVGPPFLDPPGRPEQTDDQVVGFGVDVGWTEQGSGHVGRVVADVSAKVFGNTRVRLRLPMLVADTALMRPEDGIQTRASTFRLGNTALGMSHSLAYATHNVVVGGDFVLPSAIAPEEDDTNPPTLERQLAIRAFALARATDAQRAT